jgi:hypothetical protein
MMSSLRRYFYPIGRLIRNYGVPSKRSHLTHFPCRRYARHLNLYLTYCTSDSNAAHGKRSRNRYIYTSALRNSDRTNATGDPYSCNFNLSCGIYGGRTNATGSRYARNRNICRSCDCYTANVTGGGNTRHQAASS